MQILPNGKSQFIDSAGQPLSSGSVGFYFPGTLNPKPTYQDAAGTIANQNPVPLDSRGQAIIWGSGVYRQIVKDASGVTIWDQTTQDANASLTGNITDAKFVAGVDFIPGTTAQLTLPIAPGAIANMLVHFDAAYQADDQIASLNGTTLTFNNPIPMGVQEVNIKIGSTIAIGTPGNGTVSDVSVAAGSKLYNRINDIIDVKDPAFGAKGDGVTDDSTAIQAAMTYVASLGAGTLLFPAGTYILSSQIIWTARSSSSAITILGAGSDVTLLKWAAGGGLKLNFVSPYNSVHVRDMSFLTGTTNTGSGISIVQTNTSLNPANTALSDITNVTIRGADAYAGADYWANGISINGVSNIDFTNLSIVGASGVSGTGVNLFGTDSIIPVEFNFQGCSFYGLQYGVLYGAYVQGVTINQSNFTTCSYGVYIPSGLINLAQLTVTGSQFNCAANGIYCQTNPAPALISGNLFLVNNNAFGVNMIGAGLFSIIGNSFFPGATSPVSTSGIFIQSSTAIGVISGNTFYKMTSIAVTLGATSGQVNLQSNAYQNNGTNVVNNGTGNTIGGGSQ